MFTFYIKPQQGRASGRGELGCQSSIFYIKPQRILYMYLICSSLRYYFRKRSGDVDTYHETNILKKFQL